MASTRKQIMDALVARLAVIRRANDYQTDAGRLVFPWRDVGLQPITIDEAPCLLVQDTSLAIVEDGIGWSTKRLTVMIAGMALPTATVDEARAMESDIITCLAAWRTAGGLASWISAEESNLVMQRGEESMAACLVRASVTYRADGYAV